jgi:hypothetical protein
VSAVDHLGPFTVYELRRYTVADGERQAFARYFEAFFPEAFQQLGALACGQFFERARPAAFTWLRAFADMDARARINAAFYYGPLWKEHRDTLNRRLLDWKNVLLLRPLRPERNVPVLPAVDPLGEPGGARGVVVAQVFAVAPGAVDEFARGAEPTFAAWRDAGVREAGVLVTLDEPNNFPQHPVRADGPWLVWLGVLADDAALTRFLALCGPASAALAAGQGSRGAAESVILDPAPRSRLRWLEVPAGRS